MTHDPSQTALQLDCDPVAPITDPLAHSAASARAAALIQRSDTDSGTSCGGVRGSEGRTSDAPDLLAVTHEKAILRWIAFKEQQGTTWLYAVQAGEDGPIKIGTSTRPWERLKTLQTANAHPLRKVALWRGTPEDEREWHEKFADDRLQGEWFKPTEDLLELLWWFDRAQCEWHHPETCLAGAPGTCPACRVQFFSEEEAV